MRYASYFLSQLQHLTHHRYRSAEHLSFYLLLGSSLNFQEPIFEFLLLNFDLLLIDLQYKCATQGTMPQVSPAG